MLLGIDVQPKACSELIAAARKILDYYYYWEEKVRLFLEAEVFKQTGPALDYCQE